MKCQIRTLALAAAVFVVGGCDFVDYYPHHEAGEQQGDLRKDGPGTYGGNNSNYPVGTPGTTTDTTVPSVNANSQGTFSPTGSYSGANVGGATSGNQPNQPGDGTTQTGTSAGH